jgi:alpha-amylase/alpha-mannosidase (GH57 family)
MSFPLHIAFIWHQHQPIYKSAIAGKYHLPWVRLHGVKDYLDLALLLSRYPKLHQTINLVPSLILQLQDYVEGKAFDPYLSLTLTPVDSLTRSQKHFVVEHFFDANHPTMIEPYHRYADLFAQRQAYGIEWCVNNWLAPDFSDLLAWHNLTWIDPLFREADPEIAEWYDRGKDFTLADRQRIYSKQREIISRILPQHRQMQKSGQLEITTSPYTHPILPLLADTQAGRIAVPQMYLPNTRFRYEPDITLHLEKAKEVYRQHFSSDPKGLWPSEQSVSPAILPHVSKQGFSWLCSDEGVLGWSLGHYFRRDERGAINAPHLLYQPYRLETVHGDLAIIFRDRLLSDLIGFSYGALLPQAASDDLCDRLKTIQKQQNEYLAEHPEGQPWLVTIALDGENCWEFYPQDGNPFLQTLYENLSNNPNLKLVTPSEYLEKYPPIEKIPPHQLHSGSWIDSSFTTWIGDPVKNRAWELLAEARQVLAMHHEATPDNNPEAWESLMAAEGSDWFWWFGEGHSSNDDAMFDRLFREHLQVIYRALNEPVPHALLYPLEPHDVSTSDRPTSLINPVINGRFENDGWQGAGKIEISGGRGMMHQNAPVKRLWYGYDHFYCYLRLEFSNLESIAQSKLHLLWFYPSRIHPNSPVKLFDMPDVSPLNYLFRHHLAIDFGDKSVKLQESTEKFQWETIATHTKIGIEQCLEIAIPWSDLAVKPQSVARMVIMLSQKDHFQMSLPEYTIIPIEVP